jgi:hypothetical protein
MRRHIVTIFTKIVIRLPWKWRLRYFSETSEGIYIATSCNNQEDHNLSKTHLDNLKRYIEYLAVCADWTGLCVAVVLRTKQPEIMPLPSQSSSVKTVTKVTVGFQDKSIHFSENEDIFSLLPFHRSCCCYSLT